MRDSTPDAEALWVPTRVVWGELVGRALRVAAGVAVAPEDADAVEVKGAVKVTFAVAVADPVWMVVAVAHEEVEALAEGEAVAEKEEREVKVGRLVEDALLLAAAEREGCEAVAEKVGAPLKEGAEVPESALEELPLGEELADGEKLLDAKADPEAESVTREDADGAEREGAPVLLSHRVRLSRALRLAPRLRVESAVAEKRGESEGAEGVAHIVAPALGDKIDAVELGEPLALGEGLAVADGKAEVEGSREAESLSVASADGVAAAPQEVEGRGALALAGAEREAERQSEGEALIVVVPGSLLGLLVALALLSRVAVPAADVDANKDTVAEFVATRWDQDPLRLRVAPPEPLWALTLAVPLPPLAEVLGDAPPWRLLDAVIVALGESLSAAESVGAADVDARKETVAELVAVVQPLGVPGAEGVPVAQELLDALKVAENDELGVAVAEPLTHGEALGNFEADPDPVPQELA